MASPAVSHVQFLSSLAAAACEASFPRKTGEEPCRPCAANGCFQGVPGGLGEIKTETGPFTHRELFIDAGKGRGYWRAGFS